MALSSGRRRRRYGDLHNARAAECARRGNRRRHHLRCGRRVAIAEVMLLWACGKHRRCFVEQSPGWPALVLYQRFFFGFRPITDLADDVAPGVSGVCPHFNHAT